jgi:hypothetical protein
MLQDGSQNSLFNDAVSGREYRLSNGRMIYEQEVLGRTNLLLSFGMTQTA